MVHRTDGCFLIFGGVRLTRQKVVLFCSHGTGELASSVKDISAALPDSIIESSVIGVYRDDISKSRDTVKQWLNEIGF